MTSTESDNADASYCRVFESEKQGSPLCYQPAVAEARVEGEVIPVCATHRKLYTDAADTLNLILPIEDPTQLANIKKRLARLRKTNSVLVHDLSSVVELNFVPSMVSTYFEALVDIGALREDQWLAIQMIWEERFNKQLIESKAQVQKAIEQARTRAKLAVPGRQQNGTQQLIIPGT